VTLFDAAWEVGKDATEAMGISRNEVIEQLWNWYLRVEGAKLPDRPPTELVERLFSERRARDEAIRELALTRACPTCKVASGSCVAGKAKKPTDSIHRARITAATALYDVRQENIQQ